MAGFRPRNSGARWSRFKSQLDLFIATCSQTFLASVRSPVQCKDSPGTSTGPEDCSEGCCMQSVFELGPGHSQGYCLLEKTFYQGS